MNRHELSDRRRHPRVGLADLTAIVLTQDNRSATCRVTNLSASGAQLVGTLALTAKDRVRIFLDRVVARPLSLPAEVVRAEPATAGEVAFAVSFLQLAPRIADTIQQIVLRALQHQRAGSPPVVLVVDDMREIRESLERDVKALGRAVVSAATPLHVVRQLQDPAIEIRTALVDLSLGESDGLEVIEYLADEHPTIRRVVMSGERSYALVDAVSSGRAHAALPKPWDRGSLKNALTPG